MKSFFKHAKELQSNSSRSQTMPTPADILNITKSLDKYFSDIHTSLELVAGEEYKDLHDMLEKLKMDTAHASSYIKGRVRSLKIEKKFKITIDNICRCGKINLIVKIRDSNFYLETINQ